ncbi:MAG: S-methyl-5-thioribose-1-phosphate isomerase [Pirellulales bacterium]|nr:S-methyl-5-thioribose-1-phosphate isomerase [Pirellulales bacterium]
MVETLRWVGDPNTGSLWLIDQTRLPTETVEIELKTAEQVWEAIKSLRVRGAPAIGIAAAYGTVLGMQAVTAEDPDEWLTHLEKVSDYLAGSRPTAVNLFWALDRQKCCAGTARDNGALVEELQQALLDEAQKIYEEDRQMCRAIGRWGADLLLDNTGVLTHCNAGSLATADYGTALAVIYAAEEAGKQLSVYADETRPLLQGARLTAWELQQQGVDVTVICDSMAAQVMREGKIQAVVTGADRIAANGDVANKIGTYQVALVAAAHEIPFYVAAPSSTFDLTLASGDEIPIEQRDPREITHGFGRQTTPDGIKVYNPAFDVTPAHLVSAIICERGIIRPVDRKEIEKMLSGI